MWLCGTNTRQFKTITWLYCYFYISSHLVDFYLSWARIHGTLSKIQISVEISGSKRWNLYKNLVQLWMNEESCSMKKCFYWKFRVFIWRAHKPTQRTHSLQTSSFSSSIPVLAAISITETQCKKFSYSTQISIFDFEIFTNKATVYGSSNTVTLTWWKIWLYNTVFGVDLVRINIFDCYTVKFH